MLGERRVLRLGEALDLLEVLEELATLHELHDEVDARGRVEAVLEADQEGVADFLEDVFLGLDLLDLVLLDDIALVHDLDRVELAVVLLLRQDDFPERASAQHLDDLEVVFGELLAVRRQDGDGVLGLLELLHVTLAEVAVELLGGHDLGEPGVRPGLQPGNRWSSCPRSWSTWPARYPS